MLAFLFHPLGITVKIIWTEWGKRSRLLYAHHIHGSWLAKEVVVRFQRLQILVVDGEEKSGISAYHVLDGIDCCCDGFLKSKQRHSGTDK